MREWSERSLKSMKGIHPDLRRVMDRALQQSPIDFVVIEGLRTRERQAELVKAGKSRTMNSRHLTGHAVDLMPINPNTGRGSFEWADYHVLAPAVKAAAHAEGVPLVWGGDWTSFRDGPHFELERHAYPAGLEAATKGRESPAQSRTVQATAVDAATKVGAGVAAVAALDGTAQVVALAIVGIGLVVTAIIFRERLRAWAAGWR